MRGKGAWCRYLKQKEKIQIRQKKGGCGRVQAIDKDMDRCWVRRPKKRYESKREKKRESKKKQEREREEKRAGGKKWTRRRQHVERAQGYRCMKANAWDFFLVRRIGIDTF